MRITCAVGLALLLLPKWVQATEVPTIQELQRVALKHAGLEADHIPRWRKEAKHAGWLPRLQFGFDHGLKSNVDIRVEDQIAVSKDSIVVGPSETKKFQNADRQLSFEVRAVWYLDELIFSRNTLDISQEARALVRDRALLLENLNRAYFAWLESGDPLGKRKAQAELDALTGGWFTGRLP